MTVYEYQNKILIVDAGMMFPDNDMIGIDYIIPDFDYVVQRADQMVGIVITHGHEDHTGAIGHLMEHVNAPIYATPLTNGLIKNKLSRVIFSKDANLINVRAVNRFRSTFKVDFSMSVIPCRWRWSGDRDPGRTGRSYRDYKFDHTRRWSANDYGKLAEFASRGVLALLADSTNAERAG